MNNTGKSFLLLFTIAGIMANSQNTAIKSPDNIPNRAEADFLKIVPAVWDDIRFIGGYPSNYVAIVKRSGRDWFIGAMNISTGKRIELKLDFLTAGDYES